MKYEDKTMIKDWLYDNIFEACIGISLMLIALTLCAIGIISMLWYAGVI